LAVGVAVSPGATQVTAIPSAPCPTASVRASATSAPLLVTYGSMSPAGGAQTVSETTKMIRPKPRAAMPGTNAWASSSTDSTLTACTRRHVARSTLARSARSNAAAACTRTSHRPCLASTEPAAARTMDSFPRSTGGSPAWSKLTVSCPEAISAATIAPPIAPEPPVTTATLRSPTGGLFSGNTAERDRVGEPPAVLDQVSPDQADRAGP
jgi:hypothetical protein